jgi:hypothetical protein
VAALLSWLAPGAVVWEGNGSRGALGDDDGACHAHHACRVNWLKLEEIRRKKPVADWKAQKKGKRAQTKKQR